MLTLKTLATRVIAISALGVAMTAPVIAATESTANTLNSNANVTTPEVITAPTTEATSKKNAEEVAKAAEAATGEATESADAEASVIAQ